MVLSSEQSALVQQIITQFSDAQLSWLSGYLAGRIDTGKNGGHVAAAPAAAANLKAPATARLTILYGSQSGNSKKIANRALEHAQQQGWNARVVSMADFKPTDLKTESHVWLVVSTHGEGVPPTAAEELHEWLHSKKAPQLPNLKYAVLALGDRSYEHFCRTGKEFDERLAQLGAKRLAERKDSDVEWDAPANAWIDAASAAFKSDLGAGGEAHDTAVIAEETIDRKVQKLPPVQVYDKNNPFEATLVEKIKLNGRGSKKETLHLEISLENSGIAYQPGDALGILPLNPAATVDFLLQTAKLAPDTPVHLNPNNTSVPLKTALTEHVEITVLSRDTVEKYQQLHPNPALEALTKNTQSLNDYLHGRDVADLLGDFPAAMGAQALVNILRPLAPRLYSIASSLEANPEEVHLTVAAVRYENAGRQRQGAASTFLADEVGLESKVKVFISENEMFRLPNNPATPIIMVGPGTGVAPFRAFLQEREATGAKGKNWLFFGDQHFTTDFLYQTEWLKWLKNGTLTQLNVAFSRDTAQKVYVQHKMKAHGQQLFEWLEQGAHFYVCGDRHRMAKDVHEALVEIVAQHGQLSKEQAAAYVKTLRREKRYLEDVY